ncbi:hypothetical protein [Limosilactobacillus reuteri]|uniref:hypothetical protein n=1 Tax=Limosilactobacillus reuteri TaxID=1598 RepID=UPI00260D1044|nr:hypothetical protein [Limosilactobacillus reuteri]MDN4486503.1 hypothetical protein [Limosilactobacillus reuteri]
MNETQLSSFNYQFDTNTGKCLYAQVGCIMKVLIVLNLSMLQFGLNQMIYQKQGLYAIINEGLNYHC